MLDLQGYGASLLQGAWLTMQVALLSLALACVLGMATALAKLLPTGPLRWLATLYTTVIRSIPDLVLMLLIYFGGQLLVNDLAARVGYQEYIDVSAYVAGVIAIGFIYGAYMAETFRGAVMAVPAAQLEAGRAYGMSGWQVFSRILLPQMVRHALPGFGNNWLVLLKTTALVSVIGLDDLVNKAGLAASATRQPFSFYTAVALGFLAITAVSVLLLRWAERRYSAGFQAQEI